MFALLLVLGFTGSVSQAFAAATLPEVYELTLQNDCSLSAAKSFANAGALAHDIAEAERYPIVSIESSYSQSRQKDIFSRRRFSRQSNINQLRVSVPLCDSLAKHALRRSELEEEWATLQLRKSHEEIRYQVADSYFQILVPQSDLHVALLEKETLDNLHSQTQMMLDAGIATEFDIRNVEVRLSLEDSGGGSGKE